MNLATRSLAAAVLPLLLLAGCSSTPEPGTPAQPQQKAAPTQKQNSTEPTDTATDEPSTDSATETGKTVGLNQKFKVGDRLEARVTRVQTGLKKVGNAYSDARAQGQYVTITVSVRNVGKKPDSLMSVLVTLNDNKDSSYDQDVQAEVWANFGGGKSALANVNPGSTAKNVYVFDIPKNVKPTTVIFAPDMGMDETQQVTVKLR